MRNFIAGGVLLAATCGVTQASIIFALGNNPSNNEVNILLNSGASATTVTASPDGLPGITVDFTSTETLLEPSSGQARVTDNPEGGALTNLTISLANGLTYGDLIFNPFIGGQCPSCTGGPSTITVNAVNSLGQTEAPVVFNGLTVGNGNNFLTIVASEGDAIVSTNISVPGGINDLRQPRISGPFVSIGSLGSPAPEPATYTLMLLGFGAALGIRRLRSHVLR
jgi:hypothetical protein